MLANNREIAIPNCQHCECGL